MVQQYLYENAPSFPCQQNAGTKAIIGDDVRRLVDVEKSPDTADRATDFEGEPKLGQVNGHRVALLRTVDNELKAGPKSQTGVNSFMARRLAFVSHGLDAACREAKKGSSFNCAEHVAPYSLQQQERSAIVVACGRPRGHVVWRTGDAALRFFLFIQIRSFPGIGLAC